MSLEDEIQGERNTIFQRVKRENDSWKRAA